MPGTKPKLLVVDDQKGVRRLLLEAFLEDEVEVQLAGTGQEAIDLARQFDPDLILLDMKMLGMNGLEALGEIRKFNNEVAVIMITAYGELEKVAEAMKLGITEYITKPFDILELKVLVKKVISRRQAGVAG